MAESGNFDDYDWLLSQWNIINTALFALSSSTTARVNKYHYSRVTVLPVTVSQCLSVTVLHYAVQVLANMKFAHQLLAWSESRKNILKQWAASNECLMTDWPTFICYISRCVNLKYKSVPLLFWSILLSCSQSSTCLNSYLIAEGWSGLDRSGLVISCWQGEWVSSCHDTSYLDMLKATRDK